MTESGSNFRLRVPLFVGPLVALILVIALFAILDKFFSSGQFFTSDNLSNISIQTTVYALAAVGLTVVIISGGIDLSCGTAVTLSATAVAWCILHDVGSRINDGSNVRDAAMTVAFQIEAEVEGEAIDASKSNLASLIEIKIKLLEKQLEPVAKSMESNGWIGLKSAEIDALKESDASLFEQFDRTEKNYSRLTSNLKKQNDRLASLARPDFTLSVDEAKQNWGSNLPNHPSTVYVAILVGILTGICCGIVNGVLIAFLKIVPFVVTLGTMTIFLGIGNLVSGNTPIRTMRGDQVPDWLYQSLSLNSEYLFFGLPPGVWMLFLSATIMALVLWATVFGRYSFALGSNESTARLCGIDVAWQKLLIYALSGAMIGLAGVFQFSRLTVGDPESGLGLELKVIAAVVIGGGSLLGGRGSILGTLCGAAMLAVILNGCTQLGLPVAIEKIVVGSIIIFAVYLDQPDVKQFFRSIIKRAG